ncbi:Uncharacterized protein dnm_047650 [Desulfonema magnum]|uniref:Uncharacterized protein n=1 Tax=Desulfonema magnum TaxID=45655 RepID=A0A975BNF9_9BACT|nr:Uncharacterized protein dnm_047650 [Desulfonema magnum]
MFEQYLLIHLKSLLFFKTMQRLSKWPGIFSKNTRNTGGVR